VSAERRQAIREITIDVLKAARTDAADRVYPTPILPWRRERPLPAIGVYTLDERGTPMTLGGSNMGPFQFRQSLELRIEVVVELPTDADQTPDERLRLDTAVPLDRLCAQVERATRRNPDWYIPCDSIEGIEAWWTHQELGRVEDTDRRTAAAIVTALVNYTDIDEPEIADRLEDVGIAVDVIDPAADPNTTGHPTEPPPHYPGGYPGPDGRIEVEFNVPGPGQPPFWPPDASRED
jgi:hypothetical protein